MARYIDAEISEDVEKTNCGKWTKIAKDFVTCNICGMIRNIKTQYGWSFCPSCGAKMDGEENN